MKMSFEVDVPFEIPTLRFTLERDHRAWAGANSRFLLSCYMDKGREMYALALRMKSLDDVGRCAQLLAKSAAWSVELLERWPMDYETGRQVDCPIPNEWFNGKPMFRACAQGEMAALESEEGWATT